VLGVCREPRPNVRMLLIIVVKPCCYCC